MSVRSSREIYKCKKCNLVKRGHVCKIYDQQEQEKIVNNRNNVKQFYKKLVIDNGITKSNDFIIETLKDKRDIQVENKGMSEKKYELLSLLQKRIEKQLKSVEDDMNENRLIRKKKHKQYSRERLEEWERNESLKGHREVEDNILEKELCLELCEWNEWNEMEKHDVSNVGINTDLCLKLDHWNGLKGRSEEEVSSHTNHTTKENTENFQGIDEIIQASDESAMKIELEWYEDLV